MTDHPDPAPSAFADFDEETDDSANVDTYAAELAAAAEAFGIPPGPGTLEPEAD